MERATHTAPDRHSTGPAVVLGEHLDVRPDPLDDRRADEHAREGAAGACPATVERRLERLALAAVAVAADGDVDHAERRLVGAAVDAPRARAGSARRTYRARADRRAGAPRSGVAQLRRVEQLVDRRRLAAGQDDRVDASEVLGTLHLDARRRPARRAPHDARGTPPGARGRRPSCPGGTASTRPLTPLIARAPPEFSWPTSHGRTHGARHQPRSASLTSRVADLLAGHRRRRARATPWPRSSASA